MEALAVNDVVALLALDDVYWDALLIQEGPIAEKSGCTIIEGGHAS